MKLIKTYSSTGAHDGYFDHIKGFSYRVATETRSRPESVTTTYRVRVYMPCVDSDGDQLNDFLSPSLATVEEALTELDRIAALISGTAPAQGWVKGAPPLREGQWFLALNHSSEPVAVLHTPRGVPYRDSCHNGYTPQSFAHHLPTPIVAPKES